MTRNFITKLLIRLFFGVLIFFANACFSQQTLNKKNSTTGIHYVTFKKFEINTYKSYLHDSPSDGSSTAAYLVMGDHINPQKKVNGFYYIEFKNSKGHVSIGWISKNDVLEIDSTTQDYIPRSNATSASATENQEMNSYLSFEDLLTLLEDNDHTSESLHSIIEKKNNTWVYNGIDQQNNELLFATNRRIAANNEFLSWHIREGILEYIVKNRLSYLHLIKDIKWTGFDVISKNSKNDIITTTYSANSIVIQVSQVLLSDRKNYAYKFYLGQKR